MSYEGYTEYLCENGHYYTRDAYESYYTEEKKCPYCVSEAVWSNGVDQTNDSGFKFGTDRLIVKDAAVYDECECCGNKRLLQRETYHIPGEKQMSEYRKDYDEFYESLYSHIKPASENEWD